MSMEFTFDALIALMNSKCETPQVIESCYHGNRDTFVTLLFEGSLSSYLGSVFFLPVEFVWQPQFRFMM